MAPVVRIEPNGPLLKDRFSLSSGKRGTQAMIPKPNRKKSAWRYRFSCEWERLCGVFI
jgi:hypothetical protein